MPLKSWKTSCGRPFPLGATVCQRGINFAIYSRHAERIDLEFFTDAADDTPTASFCLTPERHRTGDIWHIFVEGARHRQLYGYRAHGEYAPKLGHQFNAKKLLSDPYARAFAGVYDSGDPSIYGFTSDVEEPRASDRDSGGHVPKCVALAPGDFDWRGDRPLRRPLSETVIYELHVKGFTAHPSSNVTRPGTYLGLAEKIPHLKSLGVTAVELLPIHHFDRTERLVPRPEGTSLTNFWGYSTLGFFAPQAHYATGGAPGSCVTEFKEMVRAFHEAGIEVILDVVFNHTGEGGDTGPTYCFRGLDNKSYYLLNSEGQHIDYTGCGNTLACNRTVVRQLIIDALRYWTVEMHVDGFRFDLATVLARDDRGKWVTPNSLLDDIATDPVLGDVKLISESWDPGGMYKVGQLPAGWLDWNDRFRDDTRRFVRGDEGQTASLTRRIGGSRDLFDHRSRETRSINFVVCHDGFTLRDLVSYEGKHNLANEEDNRDGADENWSANYGAEGETADLAIGEVRRRQAKNLLVLLLTARGIPMLLAGDELWRTQRGNNNAYCHDSELSWIDWTLTREGSEMHRFVTLLVALRQNSPALRRMALVDPFVDFADGREDDTAPPEIIWHGVKPRSADWGHHAQSVAFQIASARKNESNAADRGDIYVAVNAWTESLEHQLPSLTKGVSWFVVVDTALASPMDIVPVSEARPIQQSVYAVEGRAAVVLVAR